MDIREYQNKAPETAAFANDDIAFDCVVAGMMGELGEVMELWKKFRRGDYEQRGIAHIDAFKEFQKKTAMELGDMMWYIAMYAYLWNIDLGWALEYNLEKLNKRKESGLLHASKEDRFDFEQEEQD